MADQIDRKEQVESALDYLQKQVHSIGDEDLAALAQYVLDDNNFVSCPGSKGGTNHGHHAYDGGLAVHTSEVLEIALGMTDAQGLDIDDDILITATIWHDYGKIFDYGSKREDGSYNVKPHYTLIRHLSRSYAEFMCVATEYCIDSEVIDKIGHAILAHHGRREWGSPTEPITTEAFVLHAADHISAQCSKDYYVRD
jgi:3'-5' exoribonuclease